MMIDGPLKVLQGVRKQSNIGGPDLKIIVMV